MHRIINDPKRCENEFASSKCGLAFFGAGETLSRYFSLFQAKNYAPSFHTRDNVAQEFVVFMSISQQQLSAYVRPLLSQFLNRRYVFCSQKLNYCTLSVPH
jgi:hypothetical protein